MKLAYIEWVDSRAIGRGWTLAEDIQSKPMTCHSVGWIYRQTAKSIMLCPHYTTEPEQYNGGIEIPLCSITKIKTINAKPRPKHRGNAGHG